MTRMGHRTAARDGSLRRTRTAAWIVFTSMAGTTMAFQVYHSVKSGQMPDALAVLFGIVPLLISICILEIVAEWEHAPWWAKTAAYLIMGGSMFMSASATGDVVLHAAPRHLSLLFGFLLDGAALLAVHFLLSGSPAISRAHAEEAAARQELLEAERAAAESERDARAEAEAALAMTRKELADATAVAAAAEAARQELEPERAARETAEAERDAAASARETAERDLAEALARAEAIAQKLAIVSGKKALKPPRKGVRESAQADDVTNELRALMELKADPDLCRARMGGELARRLGVAAATGRRLHQRLTLDGHLRESLSERSLEHPDERSGERSDERS